MQAQYIVRAYRVPGLHPAERLVLADLANYADDRHRLAWPSRALLCTNLGLHPKTVQAALRRLIALGYVSEAERAQTRRTRKLRLHPEAWPSPDEREEATA